MLDFATSMSFYYCLIYIESTELNITRALLQDEVVTDQDEDVPLTFEDFLEKFAPQLKDLTPEPGKDIPLF